MIWLIPTIAAILWTALIFSSPPPCRTCDYYKDYKALGKWVCTKCDVRA